MLVWYCYNTMCSVILCLNVTLYVLRYVLQRDIHNTHSTTINAVSKVKTHTIMPQSATQYPKIVCPCMARTVYVCACPQCRNVIELGVVEGWFVGDAVMC